MENNLDGLEGNEYYEEQWRLFRIKMDNKNYQQHTEWENERQKQKDRKSETEGKKGRL